MSGLPQRADRRDAFADHVLGLAGLDAELYRPGPLERRVGACLSALRARSIDRAAHLLATAPELRRVATDALLLGVTQFFRDADVFDRLAGHVLPALLTSGADPIRVWSAGCSNGAELYSVAMLAAGAGVLNRCEFVGTDCRSTAVADALGGVFDARTFESAPRDLAARYAEPVAGHRVRVAAALRDRCRWRVADLTRDVEPGPWHLILCRNLTMYLQQDCADAVFGRLERECVPGGYLVVGRAERLAGARLVARCIYRTVPR
ncbi:MAG: hypothetical protein IT184_05610 [Acidobacteria bacterium]|nr:hypothetical protein [Acidobacteriota bacterium]